MSEDFFVDNLPYMFSSWKEYRDFLIDKLIEDETIKERHKKWHATHEKDIELLKEFLSQKQKDNIYKAQIQSIMVNDIECTKLQRISV